MRGSTRCTWNDFDEHAGQVVRCSRRSLREPRDEAPVPQPARRLRACSTSSCCCARARPRTRSSCACTPPRILAHVRAIAATGGDAGDGTAMGRFGDEIAVLAAGGTIVAADAVLRRRRRQRLRARAPPGPPRRAGEVDGLLRVLEHRHRDPPRAAGARRGRVAVVDWDVHHGNGTETIFLGDPSVLSISLHQDEHYPPGRGRVDVVGEGAGAAPTSTSRCLPAAGSRPTAYAFERVVVPALRAFRPELVIVASGFDASAYDPLGRMDLGADDFRALTATLMEVAAEVCDGRLLMSHEGGYSSFYVPYCGLAVIEQMSGAAQRHRLRRGRAPTATATAPERSRSTSEPRSSAPPRTWIWSPRPASTPVPDLGQVAHAGVRPARSGQTRTLRVRPARWCQTPLRHRRSLRQPSTPVEARVDQVAAERADLRRSRP